MIEYGLAPEDTHAPKPSRNKTVERESMSLLLAPEQCLVLRVWERPRAWCLEERTVCRLQCGGQCG